MKVLRGVATRRWRRDDLVVQSGDQHWEESIRSLSAFVARRVPASDVDDVVQEILVRASESISSLRAEDRAVAWLLTVARRAIADWYRQRARSQETQELREEHVDESIREPADAACYEGEHDVHEEVLSWLRPIAEGLAEPYRTAVVRADFDKVPQRELAKELGLSESGLKSRVQRARVMIGDALKRCCEVEFGRGGRAVGFRRLQGGSC